MNLLLVFQTSSTADSFRKNQVKDIIAVIEACMRDLEKADSVVLPAGDEKERKRRKDLVNSLNVRPKIYFSRAIYSAFFIALI